MGVYGSPQADLNLYSNIPPYQLFHESIILIIIIYHKCLILSPESLLVQCLLFTGIAALMGIYSFLPNSKSISYVSPKSQLLFYNPSHFLTSQPSRSHFSLNSNST